MLLVLLLRLLKILNVNQGGAIVQGIMLGLKDFESPPV